RRDAIAEIALRVQRALGKTFSQEAISGPNGIAAQMRRFDASDVIYAVQVNPAIARALVDDHITVGGTGEALVPARGLPNLSWLSPTYVAAQMGVSSGTGVTTPGGKPLPGLHGHSLDSVKVGSNELTESSANHISASPTPIFSVTFTNGGEHDEQ